MSKVNSLHYNEKITIEMAEELYWRLSREMSQFKRQWAFSFLGSSIAISIGLTLLASAMLFESAVPWRDLALTENGVGIVIGMIIGFGLSILVLGLLFLLRCFFAKGIMRETDVALTNLRKVIGCEAELA